MSEQKKYARLKVSGLWSKTSDKGDYLTGGSDGVQFTIFPNGFKTNESHPDYILYTSVPDEEGKILKGSSAVMAVVDVKAPVKREG